MNGVGKTSLLEAVNLCLYGGKNNIIFNWFNKNNKLENKYYIYVSLSFHDNENTVEVIRTYSIPSPLAKPKINDIKSTLTVKYNDEIFENPDRAEDFLTLKIPKNISQFFFFDGEKIQEIVNDGFSKDDIRESVEALLGIELLKKLYEDLKKVIADERKNYPNISDASIPNREKEIEDLKNELETAIAGVQDLEKDIKENEEEKEQLTKAFEERFGKFPDIIENKKELEIERRNLKKENDKLDDSINNFCKESLSFVLLTNFLPELKNQIKKERTFKNDRRAFEEKNELVNKIIENLFGKECIICKRPVQFDREKLFQEISSRIFKQSPEQIDVILDSSEKEDASILNLNLEENYRKILDFKNMLNQKEDITNRLQDIEKKFRASELEKEDETNFQEIHKKISEKEKFIGRRKAEWSDLREKKSKLEDDIAIKERDLNKVYENYEKKKEANRLVEYSGKLNCVIEKYIEIYRTNKIKELEKNLFDIFIKIFAKKIQEIKINEKTLDITLKEDENKSINYREFSAGEKEIFAISFLWALSKTSNLELPIIIDTPLARLDHNYRESLIRHYFPFASKQVIILSQNEEIVPDSEFHKMLNPSIYLEKTLTYDYSDNKTTICDGYFIN
ncbi:MAG: DNA sulfur modification protein DndD [Desulfobacteraceae bacterium IS3]|nr:MAG: DNA sulfur modification protein DndD [Desulfobacteraceae bacterium IS3]